MLSKICIFVVWNNTKPTHQYRYNVVNCFQKFVSLLSETTNMLHKHRFHTLWIAFKNLYLCCLKQLIVLLSFFSAVVNCFQKFVSLLSETTWKMCILTDVWLWIAFKNLYLCCLKQRRCLSLVTPKSCELLSKICIFVVWNNLWR